MIKTKNNSCISKTIFFSFILLYSITATAEDPSYLLTKIDESSKKISLSADKLNHHLSFQGNVQQELTTYVRILTIGSDPLNSKSFFYVIFENNGDVPLEINLPDFSFTDAESFDFTPDTYEQYFSNAYYERDKLISKIKLSNHNFIPIPAPVAKPSNNNKYYYSGAITSPTGEIYQSNGYIQQRSDNFQNSYDKGAAAGAILFNLISAVTNKVGASLAKDKLEKLDMELELASRFWVKENYVIPPKSSAISVSVFTYRPALPVKIYIFAASKTFEFETVSTYSEALINSKKDK